MVDRQIGKRVKMFRELAGFTQMAFAEHIGIKRTTLAGWEQEKRKMDAEALAEAAVVLRQDPAVLLGIDRNETSAFTQARLQNLLRAEGTRTVCRELGITDSAAAAIITGTLLVPADALPALADAYSVSFDWLRTGQRKYWHTSLKGNLAERLRYLRILTGLAKQPDEFVSYWDSIERNDRYFRRELSDPDSDLNDKIKPMVIALVAIDSDMRKALGWDPDAPFVNGWEWVEADGTE